MKLIYMAHPFGGDPRNLDRAKRWYTWLVREFPRNAYQCQWVIECELFGIGETNSAGPAFTRGLEVVRRCDAVVLVGGRISDGMKQEARAAIAVLDLSMIGDEPPEVGSHAWIRTPQIGLVAGVLDSAFAQRPQP